MTKEITGRPELERRLHHVLSKEYYDLILQDAKEGVWSETLISLGFYGIDTVKGIIHTYPRWLKMEPPNLDHNGDYSGIYSQLDTIASVYSQCTPHNEWQAHSGFTFEPAQFGEDV